MKTGDIYLVKFHPGYGDEFKKYRPAVVVSSKVNTIDSRFVLVAPFTSNLKTDAPRYELLIEDNPALDSDSLLLSWYLLTMDASRLTRKLGELSPNDTKKLKLAASTLFE